MAWEFTDQEFTDQEFTDQEFTDQEITAREITDHKVELRFRIVPENTFDQARASGNNRKKMMPWIVFLGLCISGFCVAPTVSAAEPAKKMYRCGNVFQERPCEGPKAAPAAVEAPKQAGPNQSQLDSRKQIRCDNYQRQVTELVDREKIEKNGELLKGLVSQRRVLEGRMKSDSC